MGVTFQGTVQRLEEVTMDQTGENKPVFVLFSMDAPKASDLGETKAEVTTMLNDDEQRKLLSEHGLRTQLIPYPIEPTGGARDRIFQFFFQTGAPAGLLEGEHVGILAEREGDESGQLTPLAILNPFDMNELVHGAGFSVPIGPAEVQ